MEVFAISPTFAEPILMHFPLSQAKFARHLGPKPYGVQGDYPYLRSLAH